MPKRNLIWVTIVLAVACGVASLARRPLRAPAPVGSDPLEPLRRLHEITERHYVRPAPPEAVTGAVRGYLRGLDRYCKYIPADRPDYLDRIIRGHRIDLGLRYEIVDGRVRVIGPVPDSSAAEAGLVAGDLILAIDGGTVREPTRESIDRMLAGDDEADAEATILVRRDGEGLRIELTRREYPVESVTGLYRDQDGRWRFMIDPVRRIAYLRISEFVAGTGEALDDAIRPLLAEGVRGMILDLRDNPGGPLREAVEVADRFMADGLIVITRGHGGDGQRYDAHEARTFPPVPLVVLIDDRTVSAAEVVAGAIRRHGRGALVGSRTYGKDTVQTPFSLGDDAGSVLLTTAKYYFTDNDNDRASANATRPATAPAAVAGVPPHLVVPVNEIDRRKIRAHRYRAEALTAAPADEERRSPTVEQLERLAMDQLKAYRALDAPLAKALDLLKRPQAISVILAPTKDAD